MTFISLVPSIFYNVLQYGATGNGTTDDTTAVQNTINAAQAAGGGTVFFPAGTYKISTSLSVTADNIHLEGGSEGAQILAAATLTGYMLVVHEPGGAGNFRYGIRVANLFFNGNNVASLGGLDLRSTYFCDLDHIRVRYVTAINVHWDGISGAFGAYNTMRGCLVTDSGVNGVGCQTDNSEWLTIEGCTFGFHGTLSGSSNTGVAVLLQNLNNRVIGCSFDNNDVAVECNFAGRNAIVGNQFDRGYTSFLYMRGTANCVVQGNLFAGCYSGSGGNMIHVTDSGNAGNVYTGNATTNDGTNTWTYAVHEDGGAGGTPPSTYADNDFSSYAVARVTGVFRNNRGYNPIGQVTAPAFPATTVGTTNTSGYDVEAYIANGTSAITVVSIAGVNGTYVATGYQIAASGWGHVRIPAGASVKFTYAGGTPSWVWIEG